MPRLTRPTPAIAVPFTVDPGSRSLKTRKAELRADFLLRRKVINADLRDTTRWKVINHLRTLLAEFGPTVVGLYYPRGSEIDLLPLARELWTDGHTVALPRVVEVGHPLAFNIFTAEGGTEPDVLGIPTGCGAPIWPAVIICPMLGYTRQGHRLGYGGGFYDRTFKQAPFPTLTIGVCHTELEVDDFPAEYHDQRLEYVVTGKEVIRCW
ncbi:MAG: 5-formyltetrahydrofolate cyclo-ligase [Pseudomonadaceae bacterium]|nr:5-formyltetrahydrofolate cyclo-ligase [Pseudomonadaceae bacterium]